MELHLDWADGDYPRTARLLAPVAEEVLTIAGLAPADRLLDVACGTGNAALAGVRRGAMATGVDISEGLVEMARARAAEEGLEAEFLAGPAEALPVADGSADVVVSVFGVIFSPDPPAAAEEMARAARRGGVIALAAWRPHGAISAAGDILAGALWPSPEGAGPRRPAWSDPGAVTALLEGVGAADVEIHLRDLVLRDRSPEAWLAEQEEHHPVWRLGRRALPDWPGVRAAMLAALEAGNEDPSAFRCTSPYAVITAVAG